MPLCALFALNAASATTLTDVYGDAHHADFYDRKAEGWYWYKDPPKPEEEEELPLTPPPPQQTETKPPKPAPFTLAWVKENLQRYMEVAWNDPTPDNVEAYFLLQRYAMDKANAFADQAQRVVIGNAALDETTRRPLANFGTSKVNYNKALKVKELLKKVSEHMGIWFFFKSTCQYCEAQAPILGFLEEEGFQILAVSMDGGELRQHKFANTVIDKGHAAKLGVTATPAIYLMNEDGQFDTIGMSLLSLNELYQRILLVGTRNGWISEEEYKDTGVFINPADQRDLSKELPKLIEASTNPATLFGDEKSTEKMRQLAVSDMSGVVDSENFIAPSTLVKLVGGRQHGQINLEVLKHEE